MRGSTYNQLLAFHAIVREGSINGASRKMGVAPPAVSKSLKQLEEGIGLPLLIRNTRKMELTEAGIQLYEDTTQAVSSLTEALDSVHNLSEVPSGKLRVTLPRFVYCLFMRDIYAEFCALYPEIELELSLSDATVDIIHEGFDVGIRRGDRIEEGMVAKKLTPPMRFGIVASPEYIKQYGEPTNLQELGEHKFVKFRYASSNKLVPIGLLENGHEVYIDVKTALIVNDIDFMIDATLKGLGLGYNIEPMVKEKLDSGKLVPVLEKHWKEYPSLYAYFPPNSQKARRVRVFLDFLSKKAISSWES